MQLQVFMMLFPFYHLRLTQMRLYGNISFWALLLISILGQSVVSRDKRNLAKFEPHIYSFSIIIKNIWLNFGYFGMIKILGMWNSSKYFHFAQNGVKHEKKIKLVKIYCDCVEPPCVNDVTLKKMSDIEEKLGHLKNQKILWQKNKKRYRRTKTNIQSIFLKKKKAFTLLKKLLMM